MEYDAVVVGAGPYGLATAAQLLGRGLRVGVFGRTLELWQHHMPRGMFLRSHWWATSLADRHHQYGFDEFCRETEQRACYPMPRELFLEYGHWFQRRAVPEVDPTYVASVERAGGAFRLTLEDGRTIFSAAVVMATGLRAYAYRPPEFAELPAALVTHSCDHDDFSRFRDGSILIVGGAQSAIEYAALLHEAGARVQVVSRRPIAWRDPDRDGTRSLFERIRAPRAAIAPGWQYWALDHAPYAFFQLSQRFKDHYNGYYSSGAADWLRDRILGKVTLHEGRTVSRIATTSGNGTSVCATLSDGRRLTTDHVMLATGFRIDLRKLTMIHPSLLADIGAAGSVPVLNSRFESTVPGLYFVGMTALPAFGPLYRFVAGAPASARRVAHAISSQRQKCFRLTRLRLKPTSARA